MGIAFGNEILKKWSMLAKWVNGEAMIRTDSHLPSLYLLMAWH